MDRYTSSDIQELTSVYKKTSTIINNKILVELNLNYISKNNINILKKTIKEDHIFLVIITESSKLYNTLYAMGDELEFRFFNQYKVSEKYIFDYLVDRFRGNIELDAINLFMKRIKASIKNIDLYIGVLVSNVEGKITKSDVTKYVDIAYIVTPESLTFKILNRDIDKFVYRYLYDYRNAFSYIKKGMLRCINDLIDNYDKFINGEWSIVQKRKLIGSELGYKYYRYMEIYENISLSELILIKEKIYRTNSIISIIGLIEWRMRN